MNILLYIKYHVRLVRATDLIEYLYKNKYTVNRLQVKGTYFCYGALYHYSSIRLRCMLA